ncbi:hypothetical protein [Amycolatopsis nalaikhensis]|uniref:Lipoprotein n=1 Tax=Amycolatopsis nalaikhensis TaxID=715472 RepID=A0ABY8Y1F1_9PSEU|nr:hypothetical protein [Amycolatopsis sp. 2-2]WIV61824.1 hypothetical protein QP939_26055 [Amycolatopsis sp. 2-2]
MSARALPVLATGVALLIAGCSGGGGDSAAGSNTAPPPASTSAVTSATPTSTPPATTATSAPAKAAGAVERFETYLHAVGNEDVTTACEIAAPAAKQAEDQGFGPCEQTLPISFKMFSAAQRRALQSATVDRSRITEGAKKVEIPAKAVQSSVKFTDGDLGDTVLELRGGQWYITD